MPQWEPLCPELLSESYDVVSNPRCLWGDPGVSSYGVLKHDAGMGGGESEASHAQAMISGLAERQLTEQMLL